MPLAKVSLVSRRYHAYFATHAGKAVAKTAFEPAVAAIHSCSANEQFGVGRITAGGGREKSVS